MASVNQTWRSWPSTLCRLQRSWTGSVLTWPRGWAETWCDTATGERDLSLSFLILHLCCVLLPGEVDISLPLPIVNSTPGKVFKMSKRKKEENIPDIFLKEDWQHLINTVMIMSEMVFNWLWLLFPGAENKHISVSLFHLLSSMRGDEPCGSWRYEVSSWTDRFLLVWIHIFKCPDVSHETTWVFCLAVFIPSHVTQTHCFTVAVS